MTVPEPPPWGQPTQPPASDPPPPWGAARQPSWGVTGQPPGSPPAYQQPPPGRLGVPPGPGGVPDFRPPGGPRRVSSGVLVAAAGAAAVLTLLGLVAWGVAADPGGEPGPRAAMTPSEEGTDEVDATGPDTPGESDGDETAGQPDKYAEPPACNAYSDQMLARIAGDDPQPGDGEPTSPPHDSGEFSSCAWTGGEDWVTTYTLFFPAADDGSGAEAAKQEMTLLDLGDEVDGIGEEAAFTSGSDCRLLVRDSNLIVSVSLRTSSCDRSFLKEMAEDYAAENF